MKYKMLVGLLVTCMVFTGFSTVRAQALTVPAWVPTKVEGWNLGYNGSISADIDVGGTNVVSNWTQLWFKNSSMTTITGIVATVIYEYKEDYFGKAVSNTVKTYTTVMATAWGLPEFTGTTVWDLFKWLMETILDHGMGTVVTDEKANIAGADGAISLNITGFGEGSFYLLYAYRNTHAMMIFAMNITANFDDWLLADDDISIGNWFTTYVTYMVTAFSWLLTIMTTLGSQDAGVASIPDIANIEPMGGIEPTAGVSTSETDVDSFANLFVPLFPGGIPGYPVLLVGIVSFFAVLVIVQKKRKAIVA